MVVRKYVRLADKWSDTTGSTLQKSRPPGRRFLGVQAFFCAYYQEEER